MLPLAEQRKHDVTRARFVVTYSATCHSRALTFSDYRLTFSDTCLTSSDTCLTTGLETSINSGSEDSCPIGRPPRRPSLPVRSNTPHSRLSSDTDRTPLPHLTLPPQRDVYRRVYVNMPSPDSSNVQELTRVRARAHIHTPHPRSLWLATC